MDLDGGNDRVTVQLSVTASDIKAFSRYVAAGPEMALFRRNRRLYLAAAFATGAVLGSTNWTAIWILCPLAVVAVLLCRSNTNARFALIRSSFEGELIADAHGLTLRRTGSISHIDWPAFQELVVTDTHLFARSGALTGHVIPKRCLHDAGDVDRLIRWRLAAKAAANQPPPPPPYRPPTDSPALL
jgi:hypothetical protein